MWKTYPPEAPVLFLLACSPPAPEVHWYAESAECDYADESYVAEWEPPGDAILILASSAGTIGGQAGFDSGEQFGVSGARNALVVATWDNGVSMTCGDDIDAWTFVYAVVD